MFGKKKEFAPGTFIPTPSRIVAILHLSLACSLLLWGLCYPFFEPILSFRKTSSLFNTVIGQTTTASKLSEKEHKILSENAKRFLSLPKQEQSHIKEQLKRNQQRKESSFLQKIQQGFALLLFQLPLYLRGWMFLSLVIPIFLLLRIEGSQAATWIIVLLSVLFAIQNSKHPPIHPPGDAHLFPTEQFLLQNVLHEPLAPTIQEQMQQLQRGWNQYLLQQWGETIEEAKWHFNLARLKSLRQGLTETPPPLHNALSPVSLLLFILWNIGFALFMNRRSALFSS